ncbi:MAG: molybdopterin-dependent oxidoreductase [Deltaproteobacteria bacterium]|nr:molybdopterin-dependent oxidoreductase [Deltaproteobacteria bacterium]
METISLSINGETISVPRGTSLLEAADLKGIRIPRLCHHPDLEPYGACRLCLVEDENTGRLMAACVTPAAADMKILTNTPRIRTHRQNIIRMMIAEHPESCVVCSKGNRCQLRQIAAQLGIGETALYNMPNERQLEHANPFIIRDLTKCILCGKCIRADHELVVVGAIDYNLRGFRSRPTTAHEVGLEDSSCTFCGTCVSMCPTGALSVKNPFFVGTPDHESLSICGFCAVGCSLSIGVFGDRVVETNPSHRQDTVNGATLCVRGHFADDFLSCAERLTEPLIRQGTKKDAGELKTAGWDMAIEEVATRLSQIQREYGPQSIAFLGSSKCTNEENYLFQKIARTLFKTNNVDSKGYFSGQPLLARLENRTAGICRTNPLSNIKHTEALLVFGADSSQSAPVAGYYLKRAARKGIPLIVVDPRKTELAAFASFYLPILPGRDLEIINALCALLLKKDGARDDGFINRYTTGFDKFRNSLLTFDVENACRRAGLELQILEKIASLLAGKKTMIVAGQGLFQQRNAMRALDGLLNLLLMTGNLTGKGAGLYPMVPENNLLGAWDMGAVPDGLPGRFPLKDENSRKIWERLWQVKISPDQGLNAARIIEEAEKGNLKALYILGENPVRSFPQPDRVRDALQSLEFVAVQDILMTETAETADVVLPGAAFSEKGGSFTNIEGRIQTFEPAVSPPGNAKADWEILTQLASRLGHPDRYDSLRKIRDEIANHVRIYEDLKNSTNDKWIKNDSPKDPIPFIPVVTAPESTTDRDHPFLAILTSSRFHLGSGTRTVKSGRIRQYGLKGAVEMSEADAQALQLQHGDRVHISSAWGAVDREICITEALSPGIVAVPTGFNGNEAMRLIGLMQGEKPEHMGYRTVAVKVEKLN